MTPTPSTITHSVNIGFQFNNDSTRHFARIRSNASLTQRSIGTRTVYDTTTVPVTVTVYDTTLVPVTVIDTTIVPVTEYDTTHVAVTVVDSTLVPIHDTVTVVEYVVDTIWLTEYIHDPVYLHDTVYVGVGDLETVDAKIYAEHGEVVVEGANYERVVLFDAVGRVVAVKQDEGQVVRFANLVSGTYLVKIGNHPARRIVVIR